MDRQYGGYWPRGGSGQYQPRVKEEPDYAKMGYEDTPGLPYGMNIKKEPGADNYPPSLMGAYPGFKVKTEPPEIKQEFVEPKQEFPDERRGEKRPSQSQPGSPDRKRSRQQISVDHIEEEPEWDKSQVLLDWYNSDLSLKIDEQELCTGTPMCSKGFGYLWHGVRATYGFTKGRVYFEVKVLKHLDVPELEKEMHPHVMRVGWSIDDAGLILGEEPFSYGYGGTGKASCNLQFKNYGKTYREGDIIGCYLDMDCEPITMSFTVNGRNQGTCYQVPHRALGGKALFPHFLTKNCSFKVNFGSEDPWCQPLTRYTLATHIPVGDRVRGTEGPETRMDCEVIMMIGLPACGKTTWVEQYCKDNPKKKYNVLGTNALLERMKVMGLNRKRNYHGRWDILIKNCTDCLNKLLELSYKRRRNFIIDQTNVYQSARFRKMKGFPGFYRRAMVVVPTDVEFKRRTDKQISAEGKVVPDAAIYEMKANFTMPDLEAEDHFDNVEFSELPKEEATNLVEQYVAEAVGKGYQRKTPRGGRGGGSRFRGGGFSRGGGGGRGSANFRGGWNRDREGSSSRSDQDTDRSSRGGFGRGSDNRSSFVRGDNLGSFSRGDDNRREGFDHNNDNRGGFGRDDGNRGRFGHDGDNRGGFRRDGDNRGGLNQDGDKGFGRDGGNRGFGRDGGGRGFGHGGGDRGGGRFGRDGDSRGGGGFGRDGDSRGGGGFGRDGDNRGGGGFGRDGDNRGGGGFGRDNDNRGGGGFGRDNDNRGGGAFGRDNDNRGGGAFGRDNDNRGGGGGGFGRDNDNRGGGRGGFGRDGDNRGSGGFGRNDDDRWGNNRDNDRNRGGSGMADGNRGNMGRGGFEEGNSSRSFGRNSESGGRPSRFDDNWPGFNKDNKGQGNNRSGSGNDRPGFDSDRGGFDNNRGVSGNRGGYGNDRGDSGFGNNRQGGGNSNRGFGNEFGGMDSNRGGYGIKTEPEDSRGGYGYDQRGIKTETDDGGNDRQGNFGGNREIQNFGSRGGFDRGMTSSLGGYGNDSKDFDKSLGSDSNRGGNSEWVSKSFGGNDFGLSSERDRNSRGDNNSRGGYNRDNTSDNRGRGGFDSFGNTDDSRGGNRYGGSQDRNDSSGYNTINSSTGSLSGGSGGFGGNNFDRQYNQQQQQQYWGGQGDRDYGGQSQDSGQQDRYSDKDNFGGRGNWSQPQYGGRGGDGGGGNWNYGSGYGQQ